MGRIVQYLFGLPFQCSIVYTGQVFLLVNNQLASRVDNTSKLFFILEHLGLDTGGCLCTICINALNVM